MPRGHTRNAGRVASIRVILVAVTFIVILHVVLTILLGQEAKIEIRILVSMYLIQAMSQARG